MNIPAGECDASTHFIVPKEKLYECLIYLINNSEDGAVINAARKFLREAKALESKAHEESWADEE